jgi:hypothetical protein
MKNKVTFSIILFAIILITVFLFKKEEYNFGEVIEKQELTSVEKTNQLLKTTKGSIDLTNDIYLNWSIKIFIEKEHKIEFCESIDARYICKIDDKDYYGSDFRMEFPKNELEELSIFINNKFIKLEVSQIYNPNHSGQLSKNQFKLEKHKDFYVLYAFFSDGAGTYTTNWKITDSNSKRSELSNDEKDFEWQSNN